MARSAAITDLAQQQTTIFNFGSVLDRILAIVTAIQSRQVTLERFNQVLAHVDTQAAKVDVLEAQVSQLNDNVSNFTNLLQSLIQALTGVATSDLQQQEIDLLKQIVADGNREPEMGDFDPETAVLSP
jgi:hypothetical protein